MHVSHVLICNTFQAQHLVCSSSLGQQHGSVPPLFRLGVSAQQHQALGRSQRSPGVACSHTPRWQEAESQACSRTGSTARAGMHLLAWAMHMHSRLPRFSCWTALAFQSMSTAAANGPSWAPPAPGLVHTPLRKRCCALAAMACSCALAGPSR